MSRKRKTLCLRGFAVLVVALALDGCTAPGVPPPAGNPPAEGRTPQAAPEPPETLHLPADSLRVSLDFPPKVRVGHPVPFTLHVHNPTARPITAVIAGRPVPKYFELIITTAEGVQVWKMMRHRDWASSRHAFAPGDALVLRDVWNQITDEGKAVPAGTYHVYGGLSTPSGAITTAPRPLLITR